MFRVCIAPIYFCMLLKGFRIFLFTFYDVHVECDDNVGGLLPILANNFPPNLTHKGKHITNINLFNLLNLAIKMNTFH